LNWIFSASSHNKRYVKEASQGNILFPFGEIRHNAGGTRYRCEGGRFPPRTCLFKKMKKFAYFFSFLKRILIVIVLSCRWLFYVTVSMTLTKQRKQKKRPLASTFVGIRQNAGGKRYRCEGDAFPPELALKNARNQQLKGLNDASLGYNIQGYTSVQC
jgi:hypothetical protein